MDAARFDLLVRSLAARATRPTRRGLARGLSALGLGGAGLFALPGRWPGLPEGEAKKKKKKATLCLNGQTIKASAKKKKKLIKSGATAGACPPPCVRSCGGKTCGADGCGGVCGTCSATATCQGGVCVAKLEICGLDYHDCSTSTDGCCVVGQKCCSAGLGINGCCGIEEICCPEGECCRGSSCCPPNQFCCPPSSNMDGCCPIGTTCCRSTNVPAGDCCVAGETCDATLGCIN